jgi:hypothetical protein
VAEMIHRAQLARNLWQTMQPDIPVVGPAPRADRPAPRRWPTVTTTVFRR